MEHTIYVHRILALIFAAALFVCFIPSAALADGPNASNEAELRALLASGVYSDIYLTDFIAIPSGALNIASPTTVHMGAYGISSGLLSIYGDVAFEGEGTEQPLFQLRSGLTVTGNVTIRSTGNASTAIAFTDDESSIYRCIVVAEGEGSTAIRADADFHMTLSDISAPGAGSIGVKCAGEVSYIIECVIVAGGKSVVAANGLFADVSYLEPIPEDGSVVSRVAAGWFDIGYDIVSYGYAVPQYGVFDPPDELWLHIFNKETANDLYPYCASVRWEGLERVDTDTLGTYSVRVAPQELPKYLQNVERLEPQDIDIRVIAANTPFLCAAGRTGRFGHMVMFSDPIQNGVVTLYYSADKGETWTMLIEEDEFASYDGQHFQVFIPMEDEALYQFYAVVEGGRRAGTTNILSYWYSPTGKDRGGDVDGGDQGDQGELPPDNPPPTPPGDSPGGNPVPPVNPPAPDSGNPTNSGTAQEPSGSSIDSILVNPQAPAQPAVVQDPPKAEPIALSANSNAPDKPKSESTVPDGDGIGNAAPIVSANNATQGLGYEALTSQPDVNPDASSAEQSSVTTIGASIIEQLPSEPAPTALLWVLLGGIVLLGAVSLAAVSLTPLGARLAWLRLIRNLLRAGRHAN